MLFDFHYNTRYWTHCTHRYILFPKFLQKSLARPRCNSNHIMCYLNRHISTEQYWLHRQANKSASIIFRETQSNVCKRSYIVAVVSFSIYTLFRAICSFKIILQFKLAILSDRMRTKSNLDNYSLH